MRKYVDPEVWEVVRLKQGPSHVLLRQAHLLSDLKQSLTCAVNEVVTAHVIYKVVEKEVKRYLDHLERVENFKAQRRRERMLSHPW